MAGLDRKRLVLITWMTHAGNEKDASAGRAVVGTGYFVTGDLVLTAAHVVPNDFETLIDIRVEEGTPTWRKNGKVKWRDNALDAALIQVSPPLPLELGGVKWGLSLPNENATWESIAYPEAALKPTGTGASDRKSAGLQGTLYCGGGGGQGSRELDLGVADPPSMKDWAGASGAPIFAGNELVGLIKSTNSEGRRFQGTPAQALLQSVAFRQQIEPEWLEYPQTGPWLLALISETGSEQDFLEAVSGAIERHGDELIAKALGSPLSKEHIRPVRVLDPLETPDRWLKLVQAMCVAPLMIADVTNFEPAVMLALGVRSVVRRGVTVACTGNSLSEEEFDALPFNIQEIKLISHSVKDSSVVEENHPRNPLNMIANTLASGISGLKTNSRYLDLPAYDAVRCPAPEFPSVQGKIRETILVLCPFQIRYIDTWPKLYDAIAKQRAKKSVMRMRDMVSPRLVGQSLYEHIRWTKTCVVDWTDWRANVFFELGVRLACSEIEPVCLIDASDTCSQLVQHDKLKSLLCPTRYKLDDIRQAITHALDEHDQQILCGNDKLFREKSGLPLSGTYDTCCAAFAFTQDYVSMPHQLLRFYNEMQSGKDAAKGRVFCALFLQSKVQRATFAHSA